MADKPFVTRRNFIQNLLGRGRVGECMFALQVVFDTGPREHLYEEIREVMGSFEQMDATGLRRYYKRLARALKHAKPHFEYAYFDYITDPDETDEAFENWVTEIEDAMASEEYDPYDPWVVERYVAVTILFILDHPHPLQDRELTTDWFYTRDGLEELIDAIPRIDFDGVLGNAAFMLPLDENAGMTRDDLDDEGWDYLHPILI